MSGLPFASDDRFLVPIFNKLAKLGISSKGWLFFRQTLFLLY
ncbi:Uncharacterised protein [Vibrio cholerae]|nr:Uncharacterised protein [Vibrio cholerae]